MCTHDFLVVRKKSNMHIHVGIERRCTSNSPDLVLLVKRLSPSAPFKSPSTPPEPWCPQQLFQMLCTPRTTTVFILGQKPTYTWEKLRDAPIPLFYKPIRVRVFLFVYLPIPSTDTDTSGLMKVQLIWRQILFYPLQIMSSL